jgi:hypothetical protein
VRTHYQDADIAGSLRGRGLDVRPLPEAREATPQALQAAVTGRRGLLFRGLVTGWPAMAEWSPEQLVARHGGTQVTALTNLPDTGVLFPKDQKSYEWTGPFADFVGAMLAASPKAPCYLAYKRAAEIFPATDYDFAGLLGDFNVDTDSRAWIGSAGTRSMFHSDVKDNVFAQVCGEKHITLMSWADSRAAYPFPDNIVNSQLDLADLDLERHPRLRGAVLYTGTLRPGDLLFMPRGWWHDIRSLTPSISVNHWFGEPLGLREYLPLIRGLGARCWWATARDFVRSGVLNRPEKSNFFFSPPSTGRRLFDALRWGNFSRANDPTRQHSTKE